MAAPPAPRTLLPLLEHLLNSALAGRRPERWVRLEAVELGPALIVLQASLGPGERTIGGTHRIALEVLESTLERTVCRIKPEESSRIGGLVALGAKWIPGDFLNRALREFFGDAFRVEEERIFIRHLDLIRHWAARASRSD